MALRNAQWGERKVTLATMRQHKVDTFKFANDHRSGGDQWKLLQDVFDSRLLIRRTTVEQADALIGDLSTLLRQRLTFLTAMNMTRVDTKVTKLIADTIKCVNDTKLNLRSLRVGGLAVVLIFFLLQKHPFLRDEWLSRLTRMVKLSLAQMPGREYDE